MYLALFLTPWVLIYALSTMAMNHRQSFQRPPTFVPEKELTFRSPFPPGTPPAKVAQALLDQVGMQGAHRVSASPDGVRLEIQRFDAVEPRRLTYTPADGRLLVEKQVYYMPAFLERMHRRRGFEQPYMVDDVWALGVDLFILALLFWAASGLWMWWEMKKTRVLGAALLGVGCTLFVFFILVN